MQTTFSAGLSPSFYGKQPRSGVPARVENGDIRTVGGFIASANTNEAKFGYALYAAPAKPEQFFVGATASATLFRGILLNQNYVNEQLPAHADHLLNNQPAAAVYEGTLWVTVADFANTPVGSKIGADTDGSLKVVSSGEFGTVVERDEDTQRVALYLA